MFYKKGILHVLQLHPVHPGSHPSVGHNPEIVLHAAPSLQ